MKIYIWRPVVSRKQVGHASSTLSNGTHVSWWPSEKTEGKNNKKTPREDVSLEEDIELEGREPDTVFTIPGLDEDAIERWWNLFKEAGHKYNLLMKNCCHIVMECLRAGGLKAAKDAVLVAPTPLDVENFLKTTEGVTFVA